MNPTDIDAWLDYSSILFEQSKIEEAINVISDAITQNPNAAELYYRVVAYLFANGQYNEALNFLELGLATDPDKHHILFDYLPQLQGNQIITEIVKKYTKPKD
ncbi:Anaphase-promoting complex, cyclosome, subunit 3 [compost metagenome]